jgi:hypothetical protein
MNIASNAKEQKSKGISVRERDNNDENNKRRNRQTNQQRNHQRTIRTEYHLTRFNNDLESKDRENIKR